MIAHVIRSSVPQFYTKNHIFQNRKIETMWAANLPFVVFYQINVMKMQFNIWVGLQYCVFSIYPTLDARLVFYAQTKMKKIACKTIISKLLIESDNHLEYKCFYKWDMGWFRWKLVVFWTKICRFQTVRHAGNKW